MLQKFTEILQKSPQMTQIHKNPANRKQSQIYANATAIYTTGSFIPRLHGPA